MIALSCLTLRPYGLYPESSSVHGILQAKILNGLSFPSPEDLSEPGIEPTYPVLQADSLPTKICGDKYTKPNTKFALPSNIVYNTHTQTHTHRHTHTHTHTRTARSGSDEKNCSSQLSPTCLSPQGLL